MIDCLLACSQLDADLWAEQPKKDQIPLYDGLREYSGLLGQFNDATTSAKSATQKVFEIEEVC